MNSAVMRLFIVALLGLTKHWSIGGGRGGRGSRGGGRGLGVRGGRGGGRFGGGRSSGGRFGSSRGQPLVWHNAVAVSGFIIDQRVQAVSPEEAVVLEAGVEEDIDTCCAFCCEFLLYEQLLAILHATPAFKYIVI